MNTQNTCPECGAVWRDGLTCQDHFYQMLAWEQEDPALWEVHHFLVLCYHLQHPSLYSPEGLRGSIKLLVDFFERGMTIEAVRRRDSSKLDSGSRKYKITGTAESHGAYRYPVRWTVTAQDAAAGGPEGYVENVRRWAGATLAALKESKNLAED